MSQPVSNPLPELPRWLTIPASLAIGGHLLAVVMAALATTSGPWPGPDGIAPATPPPFAQAVHQVATPYYLRPLRLAYSFRFASNRPGPPGVLFEVRLKDDNGNTLTTVRLPDPRANPWVRQRQNLLALGLAPDEPVMPPAGEVIAAPNQKPRTVNIWESSGPPAPGRPLTLRAVPEHLVPRDRAVMGPTEWSLLLARSYARYLCRQHNAASAEFVRLTREPVHPALLFMDEPPPMALETLAANFGEFSK